MGTKVQSKGYLPGYYSMKDGNEESNSGSWALYCGDQSLVSGQHYNGYLPRVSHMDAYSGYDKDLLRRMMLEHEAIFKSQVYELHRLYRIQRDLMDEYKRKYKYQLPLEKLPTPLASQMLSEDGQKWHTHCFTSVNSLCGRSSVSGAENSHSPSSFAKGKSVQARATPSQNGGTSKDCEVLEPRPSKVRKKMIDLRLPADTYIDTEEEKELLGDQKASDMLGNTSRGFSKSVSESGLKMFPGSGGKIDYQKVDSRSDSGINTRTCLADLNEPIQIEDANVSASFDSLGRAIFHKRMAVKDQPAIENMPVINSSIEISQRFHHGANDETPYNLPLENRWISCMLEAGCGETTSLPQRVQPEKLLEPRHVDSHAVSRTYESSIFVPDNQCMADTWRERPANGLKVYERGLDHSNYNNLESAAASRISAPHSVVPSSDLVRSWSHSVPTRENEGSNLSQKTISLQMHPYFNSSDPFCKASQSTAQSHGTYGEKRFGSGCSRSKPFFGSEIAVRNGFYCGSSSSFKELPAHPSLGFDYLNHSNGDHVDPEPFTDHSSARYPIKGSNCIDLNSSRDANISEALVPNILNKGAVLKHGFKVMDGENKNEDHPETMPWLKTRHSHKNKTNCRGDSDEVELCFSQVSSDQLPNKAEYGKGPPNQSFSQIISSASHALKESSKGIETGTCPSVGRILGFPIFGKPHLYRNGSSSVTSSSAYPLLPTKCENENNKKDTVVDINLPCDTAVSGMSKPAVSAISAVGKETDTKAIRHRGGIDLNSCIFEEEISLVPSVASPDVGIDLEAPVIPETQEDIFEQKSSREKQEMTVNSSNDKIEQPESKLVELAAEAIVAISLSGQCTRQEVISFKHSEESTHNQADASSPTDPLLWFAGIISSCSDNPESMSAFGLRRAKDGKDNDESLAEEIDSYESMTLKMEETKVEEYVSKISVPGNLREEETEEAALLTSRAQRRPTRRGRQRRDFQRDILPGLASLSRHEVTEDLQTFGGLMRATGHAWHSGLTRRMTTRNGSGGRGKRRAVAADTPASNPLLLQLNNVEIGLEERSLTGWGKTIRRPRRQRCPAGNLPSLALT